MTPFTEKHAREAFTIYWWPVWTVADGGPLVECDECGSRYEVPPEVRALGGSALPSRRERPAAG